MNPATRPQENYSVANIIEEGRIGGPQRRIVRVASELTGSVDTTVFMPKTRSTSFQELCSANNVKFQTTMLTGLTKQWRLILKYGALSLYEIINLARQFNRIGVDLVHVSGGSWQYKGIIAAKLAGIPVVWHLNDTAMPAAVRLAFRVVQPLPDGFIFASERSRQYYAGTLDERPRAVIPSAVDVDSFNQKCQVQEDKDLDTATAGNWVLGTVANINPIKGLETLIMTLATLRQQHWNVRLLIVGPVFENQASYHRQLLGIAVTYGVSDWIHWVGSRSDVRPIFNLMDVYVCSSRAESSPMSVWEAMAMNLPVVSTDVGDVPYHVNDGKSGFIVPVGDDKAMAGRIGTLFSDERLRGRFGAEARRIAVNNFSVKKVAKMTEDFYRQVIEFCHNQKS